MPSSPIVTNRAFRRGRRFVRGMCTLLVIVAAGSGCTSAAYHQQPSLSPAQPQPPASDVAAFNQTLAAASQSVPPSAVSMSDYKLGPEDLLQITLYNVAPNEQGVVPRTVDVRVSHEGKITLPLLGDMAVATHTPAWLEQQLRDKYRTYYIDPQIGVFVREYHSQRVSVLGAVQRPGVFELTGPKTVIDLLALAGGVSEQASRQILLVRNGPQGRESYVMDLQDLIGDPTIPANLTVAGGDVLSVPRAGSFFVDGAVSKPGAYRLDRPYTLTQALATAGGCDRDVAKPSATQIFRRRNGSTPEILTVDLNQIPQGNENDPLIYADDVIVVPVSTPRYLVRRFFGAVGMGIGIPIR